MATHSNILAWRIPWTEETGGLQSIGSQRVRHDWTCMTCTVRGREKKKKKVFLTVCSFQMCSGSKHLGNKYFICILWISKLGLRNIAKFKVEYEGWESPWTEETGGLASMGLQRVRHVWTTKHTLCITLYKVLYVLCYLCFIRILLGQIFVGVQIGVQWG